jgi:adenine-specific DNA methylase
MRNKINYYTIEVRWRSGWTEILKMFKKKEAAIRWGKWNFYKDKTGENWRIKKL